MLFFEIFYSMRGFKIFFKCFFLVGSKDWVLCRFEMSYYIFLFLLFFRRLDGYNVIGFIRLGGKGEVIVVKVFC